jgi:hypothetical protein
LLRPRVSDDAPPDTERRASPRYRLLERCLVWPDGSPGAAAWPGIVHNISLTGLGLALPCPLAEGVMLIVKPCCPKAPPAVRVRLVRSSLVEYLYFHGCQFVEPLSEAGLAAWLPRGALPT